MARYIPDSRTPVANMIRDIGESRGREVNEEMDIIIPFYISDRRLLRSVETDADGYVASYLQKCPRNIERYFYREQVVCLSPLTRHVIIGSLLSYAILFQAHKCIQTLLDAGSNPLQSVYLIEWTSFDEDQRKVEITETASIAMLVRSITAENKDVCRAIIAYIESCDFDVRTPVTTRKQTLESQKEVYTTVGHCGDVWELLSQELERRSSPRAAENKKVLEEIKEAYEKSKEAPAP